MDRASFQERLNRLRKAAAKNEQDNEELEKLVISLFELATAESAIKFVLEHMWSYLPNFESQYPNQRWPRETLILAQRLEPFDISSLEVQFFGDINLEDEEQNPVPGALPFANALEDLRRVMEYYFHTNEVNWQVQGARTLGGVYFHLLQAQLWTRWASGWPTQYKAYWAGKAETASVGEYIEGLKMFKESEERKQIWRDVYLKAAEQLEQLLDKS